MAEKGFKAREGEPGAAAFRFGIVVSRFNEALTSSLHTSCRDALLEAGAGEDAIETVFVPGAYEIPSVISLMAESGHFDVLIALGCVIQGETPHAELINTSTAHSLMQISIDMQIPVINEIVGAYTLEQAEARCLGGRGTRGWYAGAAAVEMANVFKEYRERHETEA